MGDLRNTTSDGFISVDIDNTPLVWPARNEPEMPPKGQMIKNAAGSFTRNLKSLAKGNPINADPDVIAERRAICDSCEYMTNNRCGKCGCWLQYKTALRAEKCPIEKWG